MREVKSKNYWSLFSFLMVIVMIMIGYFFINPYVSQLNNIKAQVEAKTNENIELEQKLIALQKLKVSFEENEETVKMLDLALPEKDMLAEIIETIYDIAKDSVVEISSIKQTKSKDNSATLITVGFEGSYTSFKMFLKDVENNIRLITPAKINISETQNIDGGEKFLKGTIDFNFFKVKAKSLPEDEKISNTKNTGSEE